MKRTPEKVIFHEEQFIPNPPHAREIFKECVSFIEIETFTYCNRKCWFCPNSKMPERQSRKLNQYMDEGLYARIMADLASVSFDGQLHFGRYNEPLADRVILERIRQARQALPDAWLYTHTNGDFLDRTFLDELADAGLSQLCVQIYLGNNDEYDADRMRHRAEGQIRGLGLGIADYSLRPDRMIWQTDYERLALSFDARNFAHIGTDRGQLIEGVPNAPRQSPCFVPFTSMYIDWNGNTMPCCNLRSDRPEHADFVVSRLADGTSLFEAYAALWSWRKSLFRWGPKAGACATCNYEAECVPPETATDLERAYTQLVGVANG